MNRSQRVGLGKAPRLSDTLDATPAPNLLYKATYIHTYILSIRAYLPRLIPVEVDEPIAKVWFKSLLSGIEFLHIRGVVHNDIK